MKKGDDGQALVYCHHAPGCDLAAILASLGMTMAELFPPDAGRDKHGGNGKPKAAQRAHRTPEAALAKTIEKRGKPTRHWVYRNADGFEAMRVYRFDFVDPEAGDPDKEYRPVHHTAAGWVLGDPPGPLPLYYLPDLPDAPTIYVCEGEKAADAVRSLGPVATTSAHGAQSPEKTDWGPLADKMVVIVPDNDGPGDGYARRVITELTKLNPRPSVKVVRLSHLWQADSPIPDHGDMADWIKDGVPEAWTPEECRAKLESIVAETDEIDLGRESPRDDEYEQESLGEGSNESQSEILLRLASTAGLFHTPEGVAYASVPIDGHAENYRVQSERFRLWLTRLFYSNQNKTPSKEALQSALSMIEAKALFDGPRHQVHVRVAGSRDRHYLDLVDETWRAVEITPEGWQVVEKPPVVFRRTKGMLALPEPRPGGRLDRLRSFINLGSEDDWLLFVAVMTAYYRPSGPYPIMVLMGEQGSAKSTAARFLRALIDPHEVPVRSAPRDERDLMIAATNNWTLVLDNLSHLPDWLSDSLCRLATGGGFSTRKLYNDDEEVFFNATRPSVLNGITEFVERPDLADRSVLITLPRIPDEKRREETLIREEFTQALPDILGAFLDVTASAMGVLPQVRLDKSPRMADFARWGEAVCRALGSPPGRFLKAYMANRNDANTSIIESSQLAMHLGELMATQGAWEGNSKELLSELNKLADESTRKSRRWPETPRKLSGDLRRMAQSLRDTGLDLDFGDRTGSGRQRRLIRIRRIVTSNPGVGEVPSAPVRQAGRMPSSPVNYAGIAPCPLRTVADLRTVMADLRTVMVRRETGIVRRGTR